MSRTTLRICSSQSPSPSPSKSTTPIGPNTTTHIDIPVFTRVSLGRRNIALLLSLGPSLPQPQPAIAFNLGISGPKDWLKEQKKKSIKYLLAPIDASRDILRSAHHLLLEKGSEYEQRDLEEIPGLLRSASRDCVPEERNSIVAFQAKTGVEVCTFNLIVKNASSLLDDNDPTKVEAEARLSDLIRTFTLLNGVAKEANIQLSSREGLVETSSPSVQDRVTIAYILSSLDPTWDSTGEKIADALIDTLSSLDKFELGIKGCIDV